ncbi:glycosyltransferase [Patescibacteria group bacterium]|nr:glycosyltransferase [Patescibacteria group bacterium]MBU4482295.1 glycosyltransferase [Patescibacteria group bacterium]
MNNNNQQLVSVGIPTYNRPESLRRTLECITSQTYKNLEIIISDNCSPNQEN